MNDDLLNNKYIMNVPTQHNDSCGNVEEAICILNNLIQRVNQLAAFSKFHNKSRWLKD